MNEPNTPATDNPLHHVFEEVCRYDRIYRHPALRRLKVSGLYALLPEQPSQFAVQYSWPEGWPNDLQPGVYLIFDGSMKLLYVGRAHVIGARLFDYFGYTPDKRGCRIKDTSGKSEARYLATVPVERTFEAGALEEYLIGRLNPEKNASTFGRDDPLTW